MTTFMLFITGVILFANSIIALPYDGNQFPTIEEVIQKLSDLEQRLSDLEYRLNLKILQHTDKCALEWNGICFFALFYHAGKVNQEAARLGCKKRGAELGNIYSEDQYDDIMRYLRPYIAARGDGASNFGIRTGMTFEPKSHIVYLSDGTEAPFVHWRSSDPKDKSAWKTVGLDVRQKGSTYNGMYNLPSEGGAAAILCQIQI